MSCRRLQRRPLLFLRPLRRLILFRRPLRRPLLLWRMLQDPLLLLWRLQGPFLFLWPLRRPCLFLRPTGLGPPSMGTYRCFGVVPSRGGTVTSTSVELRISAFALRLIDTIKWTRMDKVACVILYIHVFHLILSLRSRYLHCITFSSSYTPGYLHLDFCLFVWTLQSGTGTCFMPAHFYSPKSFSFCCFGMCCGGFVSCLIFFLASPSLFRLSSRYLSTPLFSVLFLSLFPSLLFPEPFSPLSLFFSSCSTVPPNGSAPSILCPVSLR